MLLGKGKQRQIPCGLKFCVVKVHPLGSGGFPQVPINAVTVHVDFIRIKDAYVPLTDSLIVVVRSEGNSSRAYRLGCDGSMEVEPTPVIGSQNHDQALFRSSEYRKSGAMRFS